MVNSGAMRQISGYNRFKPLVLMNGSFMKSKLLLIASFSVLFLNFASAAVESNVCIDIMTYPEGGHQNYEIQFLSSQGEVFKIGDSISMKIAHTFSSDAPIQYVVKFVSNSGNKLLFQNDDGSISVQVDRSSVSTSAPFDYRTNVDVNIDVFKFSSKATPSASDPTITYALPYDAEMLNPAWPTDQQGWGQLVNCTFN